MRLLMSLEDEDDQVVDTATWQAAWDAELRKRLADPTPQSIDADTLLDELESELDT